VVVGAIVRWENVNEKHGAMKVKALQHHVGKKTFQMCLSVAEKVLSLTLDREFVGRKGKRQKGHFR
jgi:hypothetical protein